MEQILKATKGLSKIAERNNKAKYFDGSCLTVPKRTDVLKNSLKQMLYGASAPNLTDFWNEVCAFSFYITDDGSVVLTPMTDKISNKILNPEKRKEYANKLYQEWALFTKKFAILDRKMYYLGEQKNVKNDNCIDITKQSPAICSCEDIFDFTIGSVIAYARGKKDNLYDSRMKRIAPLL